MADKEFIIKWLEALRSGEYKQGQGVLVNQYDEYCCLGVACKIDGRKIIKEVGVMEFPIIGFETDETDENESPYNMETDLDKAPSLREKLAMTNNNLQGKCIDWNDTNKYDFIEIASMLENYYKTNGILYWSI